MVSSIISSFAGINVYLMHLGTVQAMTGAPSLLFAGILLVALFAVTLWVGLALQVKRWHDRDKSWFWILIGFIPVVGFFWILIECGFMDGTPGPNRFGPSPKGAQAMTLPAV